MLQHLHPRSTKQYQYRAQQQHPSKNHQPSSMSTNAEEHADDKIALKTRFLPRTIQTFLLMNSGRKFMSSPW
jgi:hypothetical protein